MGELYLKYSGALLFIGMLSPFLVFFSSKRRGVLILALIAMIPAFLTLIGVGLTDMPFGMVLVAMQFLIVIVATGISLLRLDPSDAKNAQNLKERQTDRRHAGKPPSPKNPNRILGWAAILIPILLFFLWAATWQ